MKCIVKNGVVLAGPSGNLRAPREGEFIVEAVIDASIKESILTISLGPQPTTITDTLVKYTMVDWDRDTPSAKQKALDLLDKEGKRIRESGFISSITGEWTGVTSKENISRSEPVARSAREAVSQGKGDSTRNFKSATTGLFVAGLTNNIIVALDDEVNGESGFIQACYDREEAIQALLLAVDDSTGTPADVNSIYQAEINTGWPNHGVE